MLKPIIATTLILALANCASAALIITIKEVGPDVVVTTDGGSVDVTGFAAPLAAGPNNDQSILGATAKFNNTFAGQNRFLYSGAGYTPAAFGGLQNSVASSASGDGFGLTNTFLILPNTYAGGPINFTQTYLGQSFASMLLNPGSYVYTLPSDTVTIAVVVPEPTTYIALAGFVGLGLFMWQRHKRNSAQAS